MRFIFRFLELFPPIGECSPNTIGLRLLATKQMLSLLQCLREAVEKKENVFSFEGWADFMDNEEKAAYYKQILDSYATKYDKTRQQFEELSAIAKKDKKLASVCDTNFSRAELLSLLSAKYSIEECKQVWAELCRKKERHSEEEYNASFSKVALRLDFTMTFYQLNCLLIDYFHDPDYFARNSKTDTIIDYQPVVLTTL
jgi:hypothetical protein